MATTETDTHWGLDVAETTAVPDVGEWPYAWQPTLLELQEVWRRLYAQLLGDDWLTKPCVLGVSGGILGDGSTTNAIGLAVTMASDLEKSVLLVDFDLSNPAIGEAFGLDPAPGLAEYLRGQCELQDALRQSRLKNLWLLSAGGEAKDHSRLARASSARELLSISRSRFDITILDLPPILTSSDAEVMASQTDLFVLVVRAGITPSSVVNRAIGLRGEDKISGIIINGVRSAIPGWLRRLL